MWIRPCLWVVLSHIQPLKHLACFWNGLPTGKKIVLISFFLDDFLLESPLVHLLVWIAWPSSNPWHLIWGSSGGGRLLAQLLNLHIWVYYWTQSRAHPASRLINYSLSSSYWQRSGASKMYVKSSGAS